jgi:hypothetical protein
MLPVLAPLAVYSASSKGWPRGLAIRSRSRESVDLPAFKVPVLQHLVLDRVVSVNEAKDAAVGQEGIVALVIGNQAGQSVADDRVLNTGQGNNPAKDFPVAKLNGAFFWRGQVVLPAGGGKCDEIVDFRDDYHKAHPPWERARQRDRNLDLG